MNQHARPNMPSLDAYWMPFTANRQFKQAPRLLASASGMHYTDMDGRTVLDGTAGLWCVNAGHGRREIASAVERQLLTLDYAPSFQMGHPIAFEFAERLAAIAPGPEGQKLDRVFFTGSGSESVTPRSRSPSPTSAPSARARAPASSDASAAITASASAASRSGASSTTAASSRR